MSDKPTVHGSIAAIRKERKTLPDFRFALTGNKIVTFRDPTTMSPDDYEKMQQFGAVNGAVPWREAVRAVVKTQDDFKKIEKEVEDDKMDIYELSEMMDDHRQYYESLYGDPSK